MGQEEGVRARKRENSTAPRRSKVRGWRKVESSEKVEGRREDNKTSDAPLQTEQLIPDPQGGNAFTHTVGNSVRCREVGRARRGNIGSRQVEKGRRGPSMAGLRGAVGLV